MAETSKRRAFRCARGVFMWLMALSVIIPFMIVLFNAFKTRQEAVVMSLALPGKLHWENFSRVWTKGSLLRSFGNSLLVTVLAVFICTLTSAMCAFVLSRNRSKLFRRLYMLFSLGLMFPLSMVSVVKVMRLFGLYNSLPGMALLYAALMCPLAIFLFYGFVAGIPRELDEAGIIDGAGPVRLFFRIVLPAMRPVTVTVLMISFLQAWNEFTIPLYLLPDPDKSVVVQQVYRFYGTYTANWNLVCVVILYAILPILVVYVIGQKYIISGMVAGSIKG